MTVVEQSARESNNNQDRGEEEEDYSPSPAVEQRTRREEGESPPSSPGAIAVPGPGIIHPEVSVEDGGNDDDYEQQPPYLVAAELVDSAAEVAHMRQAVLEELRTSAPKATVVHPLLEQQRKRLCFVLMILIVLVAVVAISIALPLSRRSSRQQPALPDALPLANTVPTPSVPPTSLRPRPQQTAQPTPLLTLPSQRPSLQQPTQQPTASQQPTQLPTMQPTPGSVSVKVTFVTGSDGTIDPVVIRLRDRGWDGTTVFAFTIDEPLLAGQRQTFETTAPIRYCDTSAFAMSKMTGIDGVDDFWLLEDIYLSIDGVVVYWNRPLSGRPGTNITASGEDFVDGFGYFGTWGARADYLERCERSQPAPQPTPLPTPVAPPGSISISVTFVTASDGTADGVVFRLLDRSSSADTIFAFHISGPLLAGQRQTFSTSAPISYCDTSGFALTKLVGADAADDFWFLSEIHVTVDGDLVFSNSVADRLVTSSGWGYWAWNAWGETSGFLERCGQTQPSAQPSPQPTPSIPDGSIPVSVTFVTGNDGTVDPVVISFKDDGLVGDIVDSITINEPRLAGQRQTFFTSSRISFCDASGFFLTKPTGPDGIDDTWFLSEISLTIDGELHYDRQVDRTITGTAGRLQYGLGWDQTADYLARCGQTQPTP